MAANVVKASQNAVVAADDEQRLPDEVEGEVVAGVCGLAHMTHQLPGGGKEAGLFGFKGFRAEIGGGGQSGGASDVAFGC